ncbi:MAG: pseudouridine synthase [Candidatus Margulisbacteria bacterium]|jgi:23S rRNA pseudouridine2457 synthase|nr:pseudouridine synthase [Candidatus Margulisiibacteriota bacterium]
MRYVIFNKPYGVLCQFTDQAGRSTLKDYIPFPAIYPVGRLDFDSEGLLLLTDDGQLNHRLADPRYKQPKTYWAQVEGNPNEEQRRKLEDGVIIGGSKTRPAKVAILTEPPAIWERSKPIRFRKTVPTTWLAITLSEGMNRQVRKMTAAVGLPCLRLVRSAIGPLQLGSLQPGQYTEIKKPLSL